ncbi:YfcE family phosphodiesterase [Candidatus Woesearchaeota archaeon]|jgi:uncharacterized protein|nr:YfcE family phosphodiesterase [Candidatus Woesearchaeota archaeon]
MKIAIISDVHENIHNLVLALKKIEELSAEQIIFLGDLINPGIAKHISKLNIPTFAIFGNNDGDISGLMEVSLQKGSNLKFGFTNYDIVKFDNRKIFLTHFPMLAKPMAKSKEFDAVFYGHNHEKHQEMIGDCLVLNPGELSAHKTKTASIALYDTKTNTAEIIILEGSISTKTDEAEKYFKQIIDNTHKY